LRGPRSPSNIMWSGVVRAEAYVHAKFHLDQSDRLATVHQHHRQDRTDRTGQTDRKTAVA